MLVQVPTPVEDSRMSDPPFMCQVAGCTRGPWDMTCDIQNNVGHAAHHVKLELHWKMVQMNALKPVTYLPPGPCRIEGCTLKTPDDSFLSIKECKKKLYIHPPGHGSVGDPTRNAESQKV